MIDLPACRVRNILVTNVPAASVESVAEHAIALFFALRRNIVGMHDLTVGGEEWVKKYSLKDDFGECPGSCKEEVVGVLGGGKLGMFAFSILFTYLPSELLSSRLLCLERMKRQQYGRKGADNLQGAV